MLGTVHACVGAAVGSLFRGKPSAFAAGVASHAVTDAVPHADISPAIDVPLMCGALAALAAWRGADSPEFWGAVGGIAPDLEHGLVMSGLLTPEQERFPSHVHGGRLHGPKSGERWSQLALAALSVLILAAQDE